MEPVIRAKLDNYFQSNPSEWEHIVNILTYRDKVNLYWLEQFIKLSREEGFNFISDNRNHFFIYHQFIAEKNSYGKQLFYYHQRPSFWQLNQLCNTNIEKFEYNDIPINTTLAVLHFLYWCKTTKVYNYIIENYNLISNKITNCNYAVCFT